MLDRSITFVIPILLNSVSSLEHHFAKKLNIELEHFVQKKIFYEIFM